MGKGQTGVGELHHRQTRSEIPLCCGGHVLPQQSHAGDGKALSHVSAKCTIAGLMRYSC